MKRCSECLLSETVPKIEFNSDGVCNVCTDFFINWNGFKQEIASKEKELGKILNYTKKQNGKYDVLVPFSGGLDSTYVLYVIKKLYNLKVLAFNFNNGFQTKIAKENIENAVSSLDVDLVTSKPHWEKIKQLYKTFFIKTGEFCTPCNVGIWSMSHKTALSNNIPLIVAGSSDRISERLPKEGRIYQWSLSYFRKVIGKEIPKKDVKDFLFLTQDFHENKINNYSQLVSSPKKGIKILPLPDYIGWDVNFIRKTLKNEVNWKERKGKFHHIDCIMEPVNDFIKQRKWGFSASIWYSMLVRNGQMTRQQALKRVEREENENSEEPSELKLWLKLLNITRDEFEGFEKKSQLPYLINKNRVIP